jgi:hypothetical protein
VADEQAIHAFTTAVSAEGDIAVWPAKPKAAGVSTGGQGAQADDQKGDASP